MNKLLDRAALLAASDFKFKDVAVPEWRGTVRIRTMTSGERSRFENSLYTTVIEPNGEVDEKGKPVVVEKRVLNKINVRAQVVGMCLINEDGSRLFQDDEIGPLESKNADVISRLFDECMSFNEMQPGAIAEAEKNSDASPESSSVSGSLAS
jgi:glucose/arabinose dehydrogenase